MNSYLNAWKACGGLRKTAAPMNFKDSNVGRSLQTYGEELQRKGPDQLVKDIREKGPAVYDKLVHEATKPVAKDALAGAGTAAAAYAAASPFIKDKVMRMLLAIPAGVGGAMARQPAEDFLRRLVASVKSTSLK